MRPREAFQEFRHLWSRCHLIFLATLEGLRASEFDWGGVFANPPAAPAVVQLSDQVFAVFGFPTASNPLGFCHLKRGGRSKSGYCCTVKDCPSPFHLKRKGSTAKAFCLHLHQLFASLIGTVFSCRTGRSFVQSCIFLCFPIGACDPAGGGGGTPIQYQYGYVPLPKEVVILKLLIWINLGIVNKRVDSCIIRVSLVSHVKLCSKPTCRFVPLAFVIFFICYSDSPFVTGE